MRNSARYRSFKTLIESSVDLVPPEKPADASDLFTVKIDVEPILNSDPMTIRFLITSGIGGLRLNRLAPKVEDDRTYRVMFVGNTCTGKTSLLRQAELATFNSKERRSVSVDIR